MLQPKSCARPPQLPSFLLTLPPTAVCRCGGSANTRLRTGSSLTCVSQCPLGRQTLSWRECSRGALLALSGPQCPRQSILAVSSSERLCGGSHMALHRGQSECMDAGESGHARPAAAAVSAAARCALILPPHACLPACPPTWLATCREFPGTFAITPEDGEAYNAYNDSYARRQGVDAVPKPFTWM